MTPTKARTPQIVAIGGGGFTMASSRILDDFALGLTQRPEPAVCWLGTAGGDNNHDLDRFYAAFSTPRARPMHLSLFKRRRGGLAARLLANDVIYIGGGNTANLLALWRLHGIDQVVRQAWLDGTVIVGVSAGACCLFEACLSDAFGVPLTPLRDGLGILGGSFCPHYQRRRRRPSYRERVGRDLPDGYAVDDGVALHFVKRQLYDVVSSRPDAGAWRVRRNDLGSTEERLAVRVLS